MHDDFGKYKHFSRVKWKGSYQSYRPSFFEETTTQEGQSGLKKKTNRYTSTHLTQRWRISRESCPILHQMTGQIGHPTGTWITVRCVSCSHRKRARMNKYEHRTESCTKFKNLAVQFHVVKRMYWSFCLSLRRELNRYTNVSLNYVERKSRSQTRSIFDQTSWSDVVMERRSDSYWSDSSNRRDTEVILWSISIHEVTVCSVRLNAIDH